MDLRSTIESSNIVLHLELTKIHTFYFTTSGVTWRWSHRHLHKILTEQKVLSIGGVAPHDTAKEEEGERRGESTCWWKEEGREEEEGMAKSKRGKEEEEGMLRQTFKKGEGDYMHGSEKRVEGRNLSFFFT